MEEAEMIRPGRNPSVNPDRSVSACRLCSPPTLISHSIFLQRNLNYAVHTHLRRSAFGNGLVPFHRPVSGPLVAADPGEVAPAWEILPQAPVRANHPFQANELGLLSNFAPTPFTFHGKRYASLEGFWQMMKYPEDAQDPRATFPA